MPFSFIYLIYATILNAVNNLHGVMASSGWSENSPTPFVNVIYTLWSQGDGVASVEASIPTLWENKHEDIKWVLTNSRGSRMIDYMLYVDFAARCNDFYLNPKYLGDTIHVR